MSARFAPSLAASVGLVRLGAMLCLGLTALAGCARQPARPNVILITLDTVRADHLGCYGYALDTTPEIDAIAARATRYTSARSTAPWTLPAHASLFTGLYPFEHGAHTLEPLALAGGGFGERVVPLAQRHTTLAELFAAEGYETAALVANSVYLTRRYALDQGFATYDVERVRAPELNAKVRAWLDRRDAEKPFFLFLNYMDAHRPYNVAPRADGRLPEAPADPPGELLDRLVEAVMARPDPSAEELAGQVVRQYDVALANLSEAIGELARELEARGLWDASVVVITSDHGEYFGEHALVEHSKDVYEPALAVPLIVKTPGQTEGRIADQPVSAVDVPRLALEPFSGALAERARATFPSAPGERPILAENHYSRAKDLVLYAERFRRVRTALYMDGYKYIESSDGRHELYDLARDRGETQDLHAQEAELAREAQRALGSYRDARRQAPGRPADGELDASQLEEMRRLGYLGD